MRLRGRAVLKHPFVLPHRQVDRFADTCVVDDQTILGLPIHAELALVRGPLAPPVPIEVPRAMAAEPELVTVKGPLTLLRIYTDAVDTSGRARKIPQKVYVFTWTPVHKTHSIEARRIITVLLDNRCCSTCGCGGRCTINAVWKVCCWSWAALLDGHHPKTGPFGEELTGIWKHLSGTPLQLRGQVAHMGADWEAFSDLCGLRRWNHLVAPCPWCTTPLRDMHKYTNEYDPRTKADWDVAKQETQVTVRLTVENLDAIRQNLKADLRPRGSLGMALTCNVGYSFAEIATPNPLRVLDRSSVVIFVFCFLVAERNPVWTGSTSIYMRVSIQVWFALFSFAFLSV